MEVFLSGLDIVYGKKLVHKIAYGETIFYDGKHIVNPGQISFNFKGMITHFNKSQFPTTVIKPEKVQKYYTQFNFRVPKGLATKQVIHCPHNLNGY